MLDRRLPITNKRFPVRISDGAVDGIASDRIGPVEDDDGLAGLGCRFKKVAQRGFVRVEANAYILDVEDDCIEAGDRLDRRTPLGFGVTVDADYGSTSRGVLRVMDIG